MTEQQQERALRFALGQLAPEEQRDFSQAVHADAELRAFLHSVQRTLDVLALTAPRANPSRPLKEKLFQRLRQTLPTAREQAPGLTSLPAGLRFAEQSDAGWKPLPVMGAFIKLLSLEADRGYAVLLGKLERGARYPAHRNVGPEDFYVLSGDLHVSGRVLRAGDFHHAEGGSWHEENYSVEGCTLLAILTTGDPLVQLALGE